MTEEEKKAIEDLKDILKYWQTIVDIKDDDEREIEMNCYSEEMPFEQLKIALNLIEKLQKENEKLRVQGSIVYLDYKILKDKIRELLEKMNLKLDKLEQEMDKEYDMYGKSVEFLNLDEQYDYLYEIKELLEEE